MLVCWKIYVLSFRIIFFFDKLDLKYDVNIKSEVKVLSRNYENSIFGLLFVFCEFWCKVLNLMLYNVRLWSIWEFWFIFDKKKML